MTTLTFHLSRALGRQFARGDEIVITELDHHANSDTWRVLAKEQDLKIRVLPMNVETGQLELDKLGDLLNERTRVVAIGAASNILGTINPIADVCAMARDAGALSFVDAVHFAAHELIDVKSIGCDFLAVSAYKFYGPHIGALFGRRELLDSIDVPKIKPAPNNSPDRFETGTQNHEGIAGAAAAIDFIASLGSGSSRRERLASAFAELNSRQSGMFDVLWSGLSDIDGVTVYGPPPSSPRTSTVSFSVHGHRSDHVARRLAERGLFLSDGDFYASTVVERIGSGGLVRAGLACYTTMEEVERLIDAVREIATSR
jgi:cysteine desulfurase family protein (TIGR01976 family)